MSGGVLELACRKRLRSCDTKVKNKEEEKKMHSDDEEEETKMWDSGDKKVKNRKASTAILEREKRRKMPINLSDEEEEEEELEMWDGDMKVKNKEEKRMCSGDDNVKNRKASTTTFEKEKKKKRLNSHSGVKKMHIGDHDKDKRMSASLPPKKNNNSLKEKMVSSHSGQKKMHSVDHDKDKRRNVLVPSDMSKLFEKEKKKMISSHNGKKNMCCDHDKDKRRTISLPFDKNKMQKNEMKKSMSPITCAAKEKKMRHSDCMEMEMQNGDSKEKKKKDMPPVLSKENKIHMLTNNKKENKRKERPMLFKKKKKMRTNDKDKEEVGSDDRGKEKKMQNDNKEQNMHSGGKDKKSAPLAFFKVICKNFKEFLLIPPTIAPKFADLTNRHVYLEDSEGKCSKIRLSVVDGSLAFHQGWNNFVSDHSINWGDFLLFEYTAMSKFSVRVFGTDCCERLCFNVERKGGRQKQRESHAPVALVPCHRDITDSHCVSVEYVGSKGPKTKADGYMNRCEIALSNLVAKSMNAASGTRRMTANTKEDPYTVIRGVECGPSVVLDNKDGYLANGEHRAKNISLTCSKEETRRSEIILITDEASLTQENEDTAKLTPLNAASETRYVTANTKEDPKEVAGGALCGPSVALDNNEGNLATGECKTKSIYPMCCKEKTRKSEIILITDAAPLAQENDDAVKRTAFSRHVEDTSMIKESDLEVATPTKCMEIHDSDEDLRKKQEGNTFQLECATVVDKCPNNSKLNTNGNVCRKYEAPGGSRCLEKWKKDSVSSLASPDGTGIIKPENSQKTDETIVGNYGAMGVNPFEQWLLGSNSTNSCVLPMPDKITKSGHNSVNVKGTTVQLQTKKEQLKPVGSVISRQRNNIPVHANHTVARQSEHHIFQQEVGKSSNRVTPVTLLPVKVEVLGLDDHAILKTNLQFCIPSATQTWLGLPYSLSNAVRQKGKQDSNVIMLKDPMKRLWPVFYHENSVFVGFTRGWKPFVTANNLQTGDLCMLFKDLDEDEPVYHVQITKR